MFCPKCKSEYRPEFTRCAECDADLVECLEAPPQESHEADYVPLMTAQGYFEEEQVRSFLEANNIPTAKFGEAVRDVYGFTLDGLAASSIMVPREFVNAARDLLEKVERGELAIEETSE